MGIENYSTLNHINDDIILARNSDDELWKILRRCNNWGHYDSTIYGNNIDYTGKFINYDDFHKFIYKLKNDISFRIMPKFDKGVDKNLITDSPGFGSPRLSYPHENIKFDNELFNFINNFISDDSIILDYGGDVGYFLYCLNYCKRKILADKNALSFLHDKEVEYIDSDDISDIKNVDIITSFQCIEHLYNPEETIIKLFNMCNKFLFFAVPNKELISTSIAHYVYCEISQIKKITDKLSKFAFCRTSDSGLDIHCFIIKDVNVVKYCMSNDFFNSNFKLIGNLC